MTSVFAIVVRFTSAIPLDILLMAALFIASLGFFSLQLFIGKRLKSKAASDKPEPAPDSQQSETKTLMDTIDTLQSRNDQLADELEGRTNALNDVRRERDLLKQQNDGLHAEMVKQTWLYNLACAQAEQIDRYVLLDRIELGEARLHNVGGVPFVKFHFYIINKSVFDITIELETASHDSYIVFKEQELRERFLGIPNNELNISNHSEGCLTIEQRLSYPEAHLINGSVGQGDDIVHFDRLVFHIKGCNQEPRIQEKCLVIDKCITLNNDLIPIRG